MKPDIHGDELDAAWSGAAAPQDMEARYGLCFTAYESRVQRFTDQQMEQLDGVGPAEVRAEYEAAGIDTSKLDDYGIYVLRVRSLLGGSFSFGLSMGLELRRRQRGVQFEDVEAAMTRAGVGHQRIGEVLNELAQVRDARAFEDGDVSVAEPKDTIIGIAAVPDEPA